MPAIRSSISLKLNGKRRFATVLEIGPTGEYVTVNAKFPERKKQPSKCLFVHVLNVEEAA